tara:strand:+ start:191 stop:388 length:198 start_codon:yes stop_codon:yes gene_type:complete
MFSTPSPKSLARVYNEVSENKLNPTANYYRYELSVPYTSERFLKKDGFMKDNYDNCSYKRINGSS